MDQASVPIARISDDLLHRIFLLVVTEAWNGRGTSATHPWNNMKCLAISHVGRYWRKLALASPQLWSYLSITLSTNVDQIEAYLQRSQDLPMYVKYTGTADVAQPSSSRWGQNALVPARNIHRISEIHVAELRSDDILTLLSVFTQPAPLLRRLYLHAPAQLIGPSMFARETPALREIELSGVLLAWLPYRDMEVMILKDQFTPSLGKLLSTLKDCPLLKVLKLGMLGSMRSPNLAFNTDPLPEAIELPRLQEFSLSSMMATDIANVLKYVSFPSTTALDLTFNHYNLPLDLGKECPSLRAIAAEQESVILELTNVLEWSTQVVLRSPNGKLRIEWERFITAGLPEIVDTAGLSTLSFPSLRHLTIIANSFRLLPPQWRQILARVPTITSLELDIRDSMVPRLFDALSPPAGDEVNAEGTDGTAESGPLMCPDLVHLKLSHVDEQLPIWYGLTECIEKRTADGHCLQTIDITSRSGEPFPDEIESRLKKCVGTVSVHCDAPSTDGRSFKVELLHDLRSSLYAQNG
ncbi:hypothetical protein FOMPIDRAFT_1162144 [Fomitopsis schrenkii]|uniref:F-box domain-containing protein n=1 Tax=Fomitopsis schrenkii TaxID=2126942 RepID=S8ED56_FOMSC|nr:hypothetical protein FOMPIDRAFT_1162144 [Fomitopsis schrenkii]